MPKKLFLIRPENVADLKSVEKFIKNNPLLKVYELTEHEEKCDTYVVLPFGDGVIGTDTERKITKALDGNKTVYFIRAADFNVRIIRDTKALAVLNNEMTMGRKERSRTRKESYSALIRLQMKKSA